MPLKSERLIEPREGDRVRVVLEGKVEPRSNGRLLIGPGNHYANLVDPTSSHVVSIEKLEPPVETFKPGDVVRRRGGTVLRVLGESGYTLLRTGDFLAYGVGFGRSEFTSERFERVNLQEAEDRTTAGSHVRSVDESGYGFLNSPF